MIRKIHIENFRSIRNENLELGKITVLTGANNSGKSSILYGLMVLQDFVFNPNQTLEELFALPFINLGGFEEVKSKNTTPQGVSGFIRLGITADADQYGESQTYYRLALGKGRTFIDMQSKNGKFDFNPSMDIGLPYAANIEGAFRATKSGADLFARYKWNGFQSRISPDSPFSEDENSELRNAISSPVEALSRTDFVPVARGFTKPYYSLVPMTGTINSEEEVATMLKTEKHADTLGMVNTYLEEIAERIIEIPSNGAPGLFSLKSKNTKTGQCNFLVNEGSGTNQLVTILAKIFQYNKQFTCIDEPEIHLHPSMVRKLANAFVDITTDMGGQQFLVSTHSEHFVQALLANIAQGKIKPGDVKIYHLTMTEKGTKIESQTVNEKGQVEGGLSHFYEAELSDLKSMFKLVD